MNGTSVNNKKIVAVPSLPSRVGGWN